METILFSAQTCRDSSEMVESVFFVLHPYVLSINLSMKFMFLCEKSIKSNVNAAKFIINHVLLPIAAKRRKFWLFMSKNGSECRKKHVWKICHEKIDGKNLCATHINRLKRLTFCGKNLWESQKNLCRNRYIRYVYITYIHCCTYL